MSFVESRSWKRFDPRSHRRITNSEDMLREGLFYPHSLVLSFLASERRNVYSTGPQPCPSSVGAKSLGCAPTERGRQISHWSYKYLAPTEPGPRLFKRSGSACSEAFLKVLHRDRSKGFSVVQLFANHYTTLMNSALPGGDLIDEGVRDLREQRETIAALLVAIGSPRLRRLGIELPEPLPENPEHRLYDLLAKDDSDSAHSRYNALIRRLVSFERAAECVSR